MKKSFLGWFRIIELYGATNVQIFPRARTLTEFGYLILKAEHDVRDAGEIPAHCGQDRANCGFRKV